MRTITGLLVLSLLLLSGGATRAASLDLIITGATNAASPTGLGEISLGPGGGTVTVEARYTVGAEGLSFIQFDLLGSGTALSGAETGLISDPGSGPGFMAPTAMGVTVMGGDIKSYDQGGFEGGIFNGTVVLGTGMFSFSGPGTIEPLVQQALDASGFNVEIVLSGATISIVPEPRTGPLLAAGLMALALGRRARRRLETRGLSPGPPPERHPSPDCPSRSTARR